MIIVSASLSINRVSTLGTCLSPRPSVGQLVDRSVCLFVGMSVRKVYWDKTAERIRMPFWLVSGIGRGMGVLDGGGYH